MDKRRGNISIVILTLLLSCTSFKGNKSYSAQGANCEPKMFLVPPLNVEYDLLGVCKVKASTERKAFKKLDRCACRHGGNGLIMQKSKTVIHRNENGDLMSISTFRGEVIRIRS
jgi:hypothetical protein